MKGKKLLKDPFFRERLKDFLIIVVCMAASTFIVTGSSAGFEYGFERKEIQEQNKKFQIEIKELQKDVKELEEENKSIKKQLRSVKNSATKTETIRYKRKFYLTAYCSCERCCGEWAKNRPGGKVYGASGRELIPDYSVAVDPSIIPLGSILIIDGKEYRADDVGGAIQGYEIDVYHNSHEQALNFDVGYYTVEVKK